MSGGDSEPESGRDPGGESASDPTGESGGDPGGDAGGDFDSSPEMRLVAELRMEEPKPNIFPDTLSAD